MKYKVLTGFGILIFALIAIFYTFRLSSEANTRDTFIKLLSSNSITVEGSDTKLTHSQLTGLIDEIKSSDEIVKKYEKLLSAKDSTISITANEMLELHYYSLTKEQRFAFIKKIANNEVSISSKNGTILISYNPN